MTQHVESTEISRVERSNASGNNIISGRVLPAASFAAHDAGKQPEFSVILHSLRRQWIKALVLGVMCAAPLAIGAWLLQSPKYTSEAFLKLSANNKSLIFKTADNADRSDFRTFKSTQKQYVLTPFVLNNALGREDVASLEIIKSQPDAIEWLKSNIVVEFPGDAEIMRVALTCGDPAGAQRVVDAVVKAYMQEVVVREKEERAKRLANLEVVHAEAEGKVRSKRAELRRISDTLGTTDSGSLSLAQQGAVSQFGLLRSELTKVQFELMRAEGELKFQASSRPQNEKEEPAPEEESNHPEYSELELQELVEKDSISKEATETIATLKARIADVQSRAQPKVADRYLQEYQPVLDESEKRLAERREYLRNLLIERTAVSRARNKKSGAPVFDSPEVTAEHKIPILKLQEEQLAAEVAKLEEEVKKFGRSSIDVEMLRSEITGLDAVVGQIGNEIERSKIEMTSDSRVDVLSEARPGVAVNKKKAFTMTGMAGLAGLFLPVGLLVWRDASRRHVNGLPTISNGLGLSVLGSIPAARSRDLIALGTGKSRNSSQSELLQDCFGSIAAMIMHHGLVHGRRVILVSSATAGEGKSTLAAHLSRSLAVAGNRILLIDFDLRRPSLHRILGLQLAPGVGDVLDQTISVEEAVQTTGINGLGVLTAGNRNCDFLRHASQGGLGNLLAEVRAEYDYVVIDSSPILPCADTRALSQHVDGVVLSVLRDVSQIPKVISARDILNDYGVPVIGTVAAGCSVDGYYYDRE